MTNTVQVTYKNQTYTYPGTPIPGLEVKISDKDVRFRYGTATYSASQGVAIENPSYTATIFTDGIQVAQYNVTNNWYYSRWRHQFSTPVIINTPDKIFSGELLPPYQPLVPSKAGADPNYKYTGPMSLGGVYQPMGTTGERPDIGLINEASGNFLFRNSPNSMLAYAEGLNTVPVYIVDERTGRYFDKLQYPLASVYPNQIPSTSSPYYINPGPSSVAGQPGFEIAHHPEAAYIAFLATEDTYHLETLQAFCSMVFTWSVFHYYAAESYAILPEGQTRGMAHSLRTLAFTWIATDYYEKKFGSVPAPLQPSSYWKQIIDNQLTHLTATYMNSPVTQTHRAFPNVAAFAPWQQDHLLNGLSIYAWKFPEWRPFYKWAFGNLYYRAKNLPGYPGPYQLRLGPNFADGQIVDPKTLTTSQYYPDWPSTIKANLDLSLNTSGGFYNLTQAQAQTLENDPTNGGDWMRANFYDMFIARNALALGVFLDQSGLIDLKSDYPDLYTVYSQQDAYARKIWGLDVNQFQPLRQMAYAPTTPSTNPPSGGISLPSSVTINVGQTVHLALQVDGSLTSGPTYTASGDGIASLTVDPNPLTGVSVKGLKAGTSTITASAVGASALTATCVVTVSPLATTMSLVPGAIS